MSAEPLGLRGFGIAKLCLVHAGVGKVLLLTLKEESVSHSDLTSHGKLVRGGRA